MTELFPKDPTELALARTLDAYVNEALACGLDIGPGSLPDALIDSLCQCLPESVTALVCLPADGTGKRRVALRSGDGLRRYTAFAAEYYRALLIRHGALPS
ncbi:hypothetical protein JCM2811A_42740 [Methylorubrum rhodinum]